MPTIAHETGAEPPPPPATSCRPRRLPVALIVAALLSWSPGADLQAQPDGGDATATIPSLIGKLGSESWRTRESAEAALLREGPAAADALRGAETTQDPELHYRARRILEQLDPRIISYQIVELELDPAARVLATGAGRGGVDDQVVVRAERIRTSGDNGEQAFHSFELRETPAGGTHLVISRWFSTRSTRERLETQLPDAEGRHGIRRLRLARHTSYRGLGLHVERTSRRCLTVVRTRRGRASTAPPESAALRTEGLIESLVSELLAQANQSEIEERRGAIELLGYLARGSQGKVASVLRAALEEGELRAAATIGLDDDRLLAELASDESVPDVERLGATLRLFEKGRLEQLGPTLEALRSGSTTSARLALAAVADWLAADPPPAAARVALDALLDDAFLGRAPWDDQDTDFAISAALTHIETGDPSRTELIENAMSRLEDRLGGRDGLIPLPLDRGLALWSRLAARLPSPQPSERVALLRLIPDFWGESTAYTLLSRIEAAMGAGPLTDAEFEALLATLASSAAGDPQPSWQIRVRLVDALELRAGQLHPLVLALATLDAAIGAEESLPKTAITSYRAQVRSRLGRLCGVRAPAGPGTQEKFWHDWLANAERVKAREQHLLDAAAPPEAAAELVLWEFDLLVADAGSYASAMTARPPSGFEVLDGRRVALEEGRWSAYRDRWDNVVRRRPQGIGSRTAPRSSSTTARPVPPRRYRLANGSLQLQLGIPVLARLSGRHVAEESWETSLDGSGATRRPYASRAGYRSVLLLLPANAVRAGNPDATVAELWREFVQDYLLHDPPDLPVVTQRLRTDAVLRVLRALRIEGGDERLQEQFSRAPTPPLARDLLARGIDQGVEHYGARLDELTGLMKLQAAQLLAEVGNPAGVAAIVELERSDPPLMRGTHLMRIATALDRFLESATEPAPRVTALEFLVRQLETSAPSSHTLRAVFLTLEHAAGEDFGFEAARGLNDPSARLAAIRQAVRSASAWWKRERRRIAAPSEPATPKTPPTPR